MPATKRRLIVPAFALILSLCAAHADEVAFFVSPNGDDSANGSSPDHAFQTLERARDAVRISKKSSQDKTHVVKLLPGVYTMDRALQLNADDSGREGAPVIWRSSEYRKAVLSGARTFKIRGFSKVTDPALIDRLGPEARRHILALDLRKEAIGHAGPFPDRFDDRGGIFELFDEEGRMPLSRWPDEGYSTMKTVLANGDAKTPGTFEFRGERPLRWLKNKYVWLKGHWRVGWEDFALKVHQIDPRNKAITFATGLPNGIGSKYHRPNGSGEEPWMALNLPEEITRPGEWAIDFETKQLLVWPRSDKPDDEIIITQFDGPLIQVDNAHDITLEGLVFRHSLGDAIVLENVERCAVAGCEIRDLAGRGVVLHGVKSGVQSCDIHHTGQGAIYVSGGDRKTIAKSENYILNNHLHHYGQLKRQYSPGIGVGILDNPALPGTMRDAVGIRMAHNVIHHAPRDAFLYSGNDNIYELNEIYYCGYDTKDTGAFYSWLDWTMRGNVIRHNFIHDTIGGVNPDDGASGNLAYGNVFAGPRVGVWIASGPDNITRHNIFVKDEGEVFAMDDRGVSRGYAKNERLINRLLEIKPDQDPWKTAHPEVNGMVENRPELPWRTQFFGNLIVSKKPAPPALKIAKEFQTNPEIYLEKDNVTVADDPGFANPAAFDYSLPDDAEVLRQIPGFEPIPFHRIGLYTDHYRTVLPTEQERQRGPEFTPYPNDKDRKFGTQEPM